MKILLLILTLLFSGSVTFAQKKTTPVPVSGEIVISNFTYKWRPADEERFASVRITCPNKKDSKAFNLELNKPVNVDLKCTDGAFTNGQLILADVLIGEHKYGIFLDAYYGDGLGTELDMHFEGMIAVWIYKPEPPNPPTPPIPPPIDKTNTWGVKFDQKRVEDFRQEFK